MSSSHPLDENARKVLRLFANVLEHASRTNGSINLDIQKPAVRVPGVSRLLPTGHVVFLLAYKPGSSSDALNASGLETLDGCLSDDDIDPSKIAPYPTLPEVLAELGRAQARTPEVEELLTRLYETRRCCETSAEVEECRQDETGGGSPPPLKLIGVD